MPEPSTNGKLFWFGFGVFLVVAVKITYRQLETFKERCEIVPPMQPHNLDKDIEDAIKLETLHTLAKGVNYNLARASLRIIAERALSKGPFQLLLQQAVSTDPVVRLQALKTLKFLVCSKVKSENYYENDSDYVLTKEVYELKLCVPKVYNTLVRAMFMCLPSSPSSRRVNDGEGEDGNDTERGFHDKESERCALECLCRLLNHSSTLGIEPKLVLYLKHYPVEGYDNIVQAFNDREYERDNYFLHEIYMCVKRTEPGMQMLKEMDMWYESDEHSAAEDALVAAAAAAAAGIHPDLFRVPHPLPGNMTAGNEEEEPQDAEGEPMLDPSMLGNGVHGYDPFQ